MEMNQHIPAPDTNPWETFRAIKPELTAVVCIAIEENVCTMEFALFALFTLFASFSSSLAFSRNTGACLLPVEEGPCGEEIKRFYYNTVTQKCEMFYYGGCQGNANNFKSYPECQKTCFRIPKIPQICRLPKEVGHCRALFPRYFFNMATMRCEPFNYGGCGGNSNRFHDLTSCMEYCSPKKSIPMLCLDPLDKGRCSASISRYYYNATTKTCEEFVYTGCGGSSNNFVSKQSCVDVCVQGAKKHSGYGKIRRLRRNKKQSHQNGLKD
ncbi:tissue factor pathway inhibitor 2 isoform X1 [Cyprinodon tularosa]|uniref:tissue factor pathway inhibitor 2 isoform X1 n=1 Tax=Cyprinodon tularosa TaxID=77115 RepID=UPI0018E273C1|nr:tissue factor pathway inhibitor 2 isoform X1 [Cyprinodon tularosa]